mmetsp:Transcript_23297/g.40084  ORF Transcript_23297/g.40084 Transcript_23297/m.40084 type:complete len:211 (+) Transcript_23297:92-724(+)
MQMLPQFVLRRRRAAGIFQHLCFHLLLAIFRLLTRVKVKLHRGEVEKHVHPPSKILDTLYLGARINAKDPKMLQALKITHILNVSGSAVPAHMRSKFTYKTLNGFEDTATTDLLAVLPDCIKFISEGLQQGGAVLVHCAAGISRSASIVMAFLMVTQEMSFEESYEFVRARRRWVDPNSGFRSQLLTFERELSCVQRSSFIEEPSQIEAS